MRYITQKKNLNCYSLSKDRSKSHFWLQGPINGARRGVLEKFVLFRYSLALTSIFIIKVDFPANTDILTCMHDKKNFDFNDRSSFSLVKISHQLTTQQKKQSTP